MSPTPRSTFLLTRARDVVNELATHHVLSRHWAQLSVVLKGSTARGNADRYSDVDLVLYCDERVRRAIVDGYYRAGLTDRRDGIFMLFAGLGYDGHYHVESWDQLRAYYAGQDFMHAWEYQSAIPLHDPGGCFRKTVRAGIHALFADPLAHVRQQYLQLQLDLDWLRQPLRRADGLASYLHGAKLVQGLCRISYLLDAQPYPPDKWLAHYLRGTRFGRRNGAAIRAYASRSATAFRYEPHLKLTEYPLYNEAAGLIGQAGRFICREYGDYAWLEEWYRYV